MCGCSGLQWLGDSTLHHRGICYKADYTSSFWKYCGLHVEHGEAVKRRKGEKLGFNKRMRTLTWKIADSFIKHRTPFYRAIYDEAKMKENEKLGNPISNPSDCPIYGTRYCKHLSTYIEHSFLAYYSCLLLGLCVQRVLGPL